MKKTFALAAVALGAAGSAQAQLQLYGLLDGSYGKSLLADVFLREKADFHSGGDNGNSEGNSTSRFGMKGSTDVGSGVKANFKLESNGIQSDGSIDDPFFNRQAWFGFSGGFGEFRFGKQDSVPFQTMLDFDFNGASNGVSSGGYSLAGTWNKGRQARSLQYISPSFGGVTAQVGFQAKGNKAATDPGAKAVYSFGVKYAAGPLAVAGAFQSKETSTVVANSLNGAENFFSVAGSYDFGVAKVMAGYTDGGDFNKGGSGAGPSLGVNVPLAGFNFGALLARNTDDNLKITSYELYVNKEIFKNTYAYAEMGKWKTSLGVNPLEGAFGVTGAKTKGTGYSVGVIYTF